MTVIAIIFVLVGLVVMVAGMVSRQSANRRAQGEIAAMSLALESYRADHGIYPQSNALDPRANADPRTAAYQTSSQDLYAALTGQENGEGAPVWQPPADARSYMSFSPNMLAGVSGRLADEAQDVQYLEDPYGFSYGYSTANSNDPSQGYNPTFDLWSTGSRTGNTDVDRRNWITNW